jgi:DNA polymerase
LPHQNASTANRSGAFFFAWDDKKRRKTVAFVKVAWKEGRNRYAKGMQKSVGDGVPVAVPEQVREALVRWLEERKGAGLRRVRLSDGLLAEWRVADRVVAQVPDRPKPIMKKEEKASVPAASGFVAPTTGIGLAQRMKLSESMSGGGGVKVAPLAELSFDSQGSKVERMDRLRAVASVCQRCPQLVQFRTQVVVGVGNVEAQIMFVGEAPGADEDEQGVPFVGRAGQLLTKMIEAMGLQRSDVFIGNVLKCRPNMPPGAPGNRKPTPREMATCLPYLVEQINIVQPRVLVALGLTAYEGLLGLTGTKMGDVRGRWTEFRGIPLMPTYHPSYLLYNSNKAEKRKVWEDLMGVMGRVGMDISEKQSRYFL